MITKLDEYKKFNNSKVRDNNGNLLKVYHGSDSYYETLAAFTYFTTDYWIADGYGNGNYVYVCYLNITIPLIIDCHNNKWDDLNTQYGNTTRDIVHNVNKNSYDGIIFNNIKDSWIDDIEYQDSSTVYVPFNSNQIKILSIEK